MTVTAWILGHSTALVLSTSLLVQTLFHFAEKKEISLKKTAQRELRNREPAALLHKNDRAFNEPVSAYSYLTADIFP